ncbi:MAG: hypothetical protein QM594_05920 [Niabella sp.]
MKKIIVGCCMLLSILSATAQSQRSPYRRGYLRLGINNLPGKLNNSMSPKENMLASRYGSGTGFAFEMGKVYYFNRPDSDDLIGYGLDWTVFSLTYNPLSKWNDYESNTGNTSISGNPLVATLSTKLGPVVSFNPVEDLIIDARLQLMATAHHFNFYHETNNGSFELLNGMKDGSENNALDNIVLGFKPNIGFTVRRGVIGLALDYAPGKMKMNYGESSGNYEDGYNDSYGNAEIKNNNLQLKLSLSF